MEIHRVKDTDGLSTVLGEYLWEAIHKQRRLIEYVDVEKSNSGKIEEIKVSFTG